MKSQWLAIQMEIFEHLLSLNVVAARFPKARHTWVLGISVVSF